MNIGIDMDGVLMDSENAFKAYAEIYDIENVGEGLTNPNGFSVQDRYDWARTDKLKDFVDKYGYDIEKNSPFFAGAKYVVSKLKGMGHKLIIITARGGDFLENEIELTQEVIQENNLPVDKLVTNAQDKLIACREEEIDIMIDDSPRNIHRIKDEIKSIYLRGLYAEEINHPNVITLRNWGEIYRYFNDLK